MRKIIIITGVLLTSMLLFNSSATSVTMELTITGVISHTYDEGEIRSLPTITGYGGYQKTKPPYTIVNYTKWTGVHLPLFLESLVNENNYNVSIIASDGWNCNFTREQIEGGIRTFDENNNTLAIKAIPVLAYEENDAPLDESDGPLRLTFVGENNESILTTSVIWVKQVTTIFIETSENITYTFTSTSTALPTESSQNDSTSDQQLESQTTFIELLPSLLATFIVVIAKKKLINGKNKK